MAETLKVMASRIQIRRDTDANWTASNPILAQGEIGYDIDSLGTNNSLYKIGDGISDWNTLPYQSTGGGGGSVDSVTGDGVGGTAEDVVLSFPTSSEITEDTDKNFVTDADLTKLANTSNTNTGDQDISGIDTNASNITINTAAISDKIEADDYAGETVGGTLKVRIDGTEIYFTNDGTNP